MPAAAGVAAWLRHGRFSPERRLSEAPRVLFGARVSPATLASMSRLLAATLNPTFVAIENPTVLACRFRRSVPAVVAESPQRERSTDVRMGDQDVAEALSRSGRFEVGAGAAIWDQPGDDPPLGQDGATGPGPVGRSESVFAAPPSGLHAGSLQGDHRCASRGVPEAVGAAAVRRGLRGGLFGFLRECAALRSAGPTPRAGRSGGAVRDAGGPAGPGGLRGVHASLGPTSCPGGCAGLLPSAVAELLSAADDGGADGSAGERLRGVRRGSGGAAVRPEARRRAVGDRAAGGGLLLNAECLRFARRRGFDPRACRAKTKGKVERPIRYIRESFFYGRSFANDDDLNAQAAGGLEGAANGRRHGTTGACPIDRFERDEHAVLRPLANSPYRRPGLRQAPEPARRHAPVTVEVERRPLSVYAEALQ